jgi:hypothetical protein
LEDGLLNQPLIASNFSTLPKMGGFPHLSRIPTQTQQRHIVSDNSKPDQKHAYRLELENHGHCQGLGPATFDIDHWLRLPVMEPKETPAKAPRAIFAIHALAYLGIALWLAIFLMAALGSFPGNKWLIMALAIGLGLLHFVISRLTAKRSRHCPYLGAACRRLGFNVFCDLASSYPRDRVSDSRDFGDSHPEARG